MPLNTDSYLRAHGWAGTGTALRAGALARPLAPAQKRTLAGVGRDRDDAFPFWDHLFAVAASAIRLKLDSDDEGTGSGSDADPNVPALARTTTGIISNRRPVDGVAADAHAPAPARGLSLMAAAKQAAARRILYARFFRGPVLGSDMDSPPAAVAAVTGSSASARAEDVPGPRKKRKAAKEPSPPPASDTQSSGSSAAAAETEAKVDSEDDEARLAARRARKTARAARRAEKEARRAARRLRREARATDAVAADAAILLADVALTGTVAPEAARSKKRRRAAEAGEPAEAAMVDIGIVAADGTGKKPRRTEKDASAVADVALAVIAAVGSTPSDPTLSTDGAAPKKKKKRKERDA